MCYYDWMTFLLNRYIMNGEKNLALDSSTRIWEFTRWIEDMDKGLLNVTVDDAQICNMIYDSWTTHAYTNS